MVDTAIWPWWPQLRDFIIIIIILFISYLGLLTICILFISGESTTDVSCLPGVTTVPAWTQRKSW